MQADVSAALRPIGRRLTLRLALLALLLPGLLVALLTSAEVAGAQASGSTINVFCLDFGKTFPEGQTIKAQGLASDKIRTGLAYALSKGYVTSDPYQVQLAVWNLQDGQPFHDQQNKGTTIAQDIVSHATGAAPSADTAALANLTLTGIHEVSPQAAYGTATVQGSANTNGVPVGFLLPASASTFQSLVAVVATGSAQQAATTSSGSSTTASTSSSSTGSSSATTTTSSSAAAAATTAATTSASSTSSAATSATASSTSTATTTMSASSTVSALPSTGGGGASARAGTSVALALALLSMVLLAGVASVRRGAR